ncbi:MAG: acetyl-CoA carboxylase biotin carboxyl carrier protein [Acidobacteria bacterium]|nr:acetyl-CoA carboxylase biotin carboxyl carrier protein [Acidobacteriota bacterium]
MTLQEIRELIQVVVDSGVAELEVQRGENRVRIRRSRGATHEVTIPGEGPVSMFAASAHNAQALRPAGSDGAIPSDVLCDPTLKMITSPIVGTFYEASAPGSPSFVKVGDRIEPGKVVCIIESMKLMNEIEAEFGGTVVSRLIENGKPVEYGEALFAVRPA